MLIVKEFDYSSPYLYKAVATGQNLKSAEIKWYKINDAGQEVEYFNMLLEGVRIVSVSPTMAAPEDKNNNPPWPGEAIKGTSVISKYGRMLLRDARTPFGIRVPTPVGVKMRKTNNLAAVIARYVPWLGWIGLVNSIYQVSRKTQNKYNLIARPKDRIQWTAF